MYFYNFVLLISFISATVYSETGIKFIELVGSKPDWSFQGQLWINSTVIHINPQIRSVAIKGISKSMSICGYTVHHETTDFLPFIVLVIDKHLGYAEVKLKSSVNRNSLNSIYTFQIEAYDCDPIPHFSERKFVFIEVKQTAKPIFTRQSYHFKVRPHTSIGTEIGAVTAFERPGLVRSDGAPVSPGGVCKYEIISESAVPFSVNEYGVIITKEVVLQQVPSTRYTFSVQATDCSKTQPRTSTVPVMVDVFDDCMPHWTGMDSSVEYDGHKGVIPLLVGANETMPALHACVDQCQDVQAVVNVTLLGPGLRPASTGRCKHDRESLARQERLCGVTKTYMDMLQLAPATLMDRDVGGFYFPGDGAVRANPSFDHILKRKFTVMFWMRHEDRGVRGVKEQILCSSDGRTHNRHHFSIFLHNCKLIVLLRKEPSEGTRDQYDPSEWRYGPLTETCDGQWHHYALMFNDGALFLQIDGEMAKQSPEHLDDRPLSADTSRSRNVRITVGACYHAKTATFVQHFQGHLTSLKVIDDHLEAVNTIRCIATCGEAMLLPGVVYMIGIQSSVTLLSDSIVIRSHDLYNLQQMVAQLSYINTEIEEELHGSLTPLYRTVVIDTTITCDGDHRLRVPQKTFNIHLQRPVNGTSFSTGRDKVHVRISTRGAVQGLVNERIPLFPDLRFIREDGASFTAKSCMVRPVGATMASWEYLDWPVSLAIDLQLTGLNNSHGLALEGKRPWIVYEAVLAGTAYVASKKTSSGRSLALSCSVEGQRVTEEVQVTVQVTKSKAHVVDATDQDEMQVLHQLGDDGRVGFQEKDDVDTRAGASPKGSETTRRVLWITLPCLLMMTLAVAVAGVVHYRRRSGRCRGAVVKMIPLHSYRARSVIDGDRGGGGSTEERERMADDDSLTNDVPESEEDEEEEEEEGRLSCVDEGRKVMICLGEGRRIGSVDV